MDGGGTETWALLADYLGVIERMGTSENLAWFVGHNTLRAAAGIVGAKVSEEQMREMERLLQESMAAGAMGLSTGLEFEPGRWATTDEIVRLAQVVGEVDGYYASHIRNRAKFLQPAIDEFMEIVKRSGTRGQVSHLNVRYNTGAPEGAWERAVETLEREYPLRVRRYAIRRGSGGRGRYRGGDGLLREIEVLGAAELTFLGERHRRGPYGLAGGGPGRPGRLTLMRGGRSRRLPSKVHLELGPGDRVRIETPGGGGYGGAGGRVAGVVPALDGDHHDRVGQRGQVVARTFERGPDGWLEP